MVGPTVFHSSRLSANDKRLILQHFTQSINQSVHIRICNPKPINTFNLHIKLALNNSPFCKILRWQHKNVLCGCRLKWTSSGRRGLLQGLADILLMQTVRRCGDWWRAQRSKINDTELECKLTILYHECSYWHDRHKKITNSLACLIEWRRTRLWVSMWTGHARHVQFTRPHCRAEQ